MFTLITMMGLIKMILIDIQYDKFYSVTPEKFYSKFFYNFLKHRTFCNRPEENPYTISLPYSFNLPDLRTFILNMRSVLTL